MEIPASNAKKAVFDKLWDKHLPLAEGALKLLVPEQLEYYKERLKKANERKKFVDSVPNQARWFIKFQSGISDVLKSKCLPRNKQTTDEIVACYKAIQKRKLEIEKKVIVAAHLYPRSSDEGPKDYLTFKKFADAYNELVESFDDFQQDLRENYKEAVRHEKEAFNLLKKYLDDKALAKDAPASDYQKFKTKYALIAKSLA